jgi:hypothetical protein
MCEALKVGERVIYVPRHAEGDVAHPDCERGTVTSIRGETVWVRFDANVAALGWDGATSKSCYDWSLVPEARPARPRG